jgi:hypothetical protein
MLFLKLKTNHKLDKLYLIYENINKYNSKIYTSNIILKKIKKKEILISKENKINNLLKFYNNILKKNLYKKDYVTLNKIIKLTYELVLIDKNIKKIESEEDLIINTFKIKKNNIFNKIYQKFNFN